MVPAICTTSFTLGVADTRLADMRGSSSAHLRDAHRARSPCGRHTAGNVGLAHQRTSSARRCDPSSGGSGALGRGMRASRTVHQRVQLVAGHDCKTHPLSGNGELRNDGVTSAWPRCDAYPHGCQRDCAVNSRVLRVQVVLEDSSRRPPPQPRHQRANVDHDCHHNHSTHGARHEGGHHRATPGFDSRPNTLKGSMRALSALLQRKPLNELGSITKARVHHAHRRRSCMAARDIRAASGDACNRASLDRQP
jgi:hypothetical protein